MATLKTQIKLRRDTATNLANVVPVAGEPVYATDTKKFSIGDGSTKFSALKDYGKEYVSGPTSSTDNALVRFHGTDGKTIQNSTATLSDAGQLKITNWKDERYASNVAKARWTTTAKEVVIYTRIKFVSSAVMPIVRLHGYAYGQNAPIELKIGFYIYNSKFVNLGAVSMGAWRPEIRLFKYTASDSVDYVAVGFIGDCYYGGFQVDVQAAALGTLDSNILTTNWSVSTFTTTGNVPAIGTDVSTKVPYKSTLANLTINGTTYNGSSDVTLNLATGDHTHDEYVVGPDSATGNAIAIFDETTGKKIKNSGSTIDSNGYITTPRLLITANSNTLTIGAQNASFCHIYNSANIPFIFNQGIQVTGNKDLGTSQYDWKDLYLSGSIKKVKSTSDNTTYTLTLPNQTGTIALTSDIPSLDNYVTLNTAQTISGKKTFSGGIAITSAPENENMVYFLGIDAFADGGTVKWTNKSDIKLPYSQITGTPTIPTVNNGTLTIQRNGTTVATFTANQAGNTTANITDNDTLNTAGSTNDEGKLYLVGAKSQAASAQTYSDAQVYTQAGELNATTVCVAEHGQMKYDSTNQCIRFVIV